MPQPSDDAGQRSNQTLKFGQDDNIENPIINGLRTVHYKVVGNMPYYTGSKTFGNIVSFARTNLNSYTSEPNLQS